MGLPFVLDEDTRARDLWNAILSHDATHPAESIDVVRVGDPDGPPCGIADSELIVWACEHGRIIVSHDKNTLIKCHDRFVEDGQATPGLLIVQRGYRVPELVEFLSLVGNYGEPSEFESRKLSGPRKTDRSGRSIASSPAFACSFGDANVVDCYRRVIRQAFRWACPDGSDDWRRR